MRLLHASEEHYHSGAASRHPIDVHYGQAGQVLDEQLESYRRVLYVASSRGRRV